MDNRYLFRVYLLNCICGFWVVEHVEVGLSITSPGIAECAAFGGDVSREEDMFIASEFASHRTVWWK